MKYYLDGRELKDCEGSHSYLRKVFCFPAYYGNNLDALFDLLTEQKALKVTVFHASEAGAYFERLKDVFTDASEEFEILE